MSVCFLNANLRPRSRTWMSRFVPKGAWFTVKDTIYYPDDRFSYVQAVNQVGIINHEMQHVQQQKGWPFPLWFAVYCLLPFPVLGAYFRWRWERAGYMEDAKEHLRRTRMDKKKLVPRLAKSYAEALFYGYFFTWPLAPMRRWFEREMNKFVDNGCR